MRRDNLGKFIGSKGSENPKWKGDAVCFLWIAGETQTELAIKYNVDQGTISRIINHKVQYYG